jgi:hypothetical protein
MAFRLKKLVWANKWFVDVFAVNRHNHRDGSIDRKWFLECVTYFELSVRLCLDIMLRLFCGNFRESILIFLKRLTSDDYLYLETGYFVYHGHYAGDTHVNMARNCEEKDWW